MAKPSLSYEDVAISQHCSVATVLRLRRTGALTPYRQPGTRRVLFDADEVAQAFAAKPVRLERSDDGGKA